MEDLIEKYKVKSSVKKEEPQMLKSADGMNEFLVKGDPIGMLDEYEKKVKKDMKDTMEFLRS